MKTLRIDLETYSDVDLKKCGVHRYAESANFQVMFIVYLVGIFVSGLLGIVIGKQQTPPPPVPIVKQVDLDQQCVAWLFNSNMKDAKKRICK